MKLPRGLVWALLLGTLSACVLDRTGQSRSLALQQDLAQTNSQVQGLQRQVDDRLSRTSAKLDEVEENAQLSRRNMADSGALLDTMASEMQSLRGTFEEINHRVTQSDQRSQKFQEDVDFRLQEMEKRLVALEKLTASLGLAPVAASATAPAGGAAEPEAEPGEQLSADQTLARARGYFDAGKYKITVAFLRGFKTRFPSSPLLEEAQFMLGESLLREGDPTAAVQEFQALVEGFPRSKRIPAAMLRQAEALQQLNANEDAEVFLNELVRAYPKSPEADTARARLKELKK